MGTRMSGMYLNLCRCKIIVDDTTMISSTRYIDKEWLKNLRMKYPKYSFLRKGDSVYFWPRQQNEVDLEVFSSVSTEKLTKERHPFIIAKMLEDKAIDLFREIYDYLYFNRYAGSWDVVSNREIFDDEGLSIKRCITFSSYYSSFSSTNYFGFTLSTRLKYVFNWDKSRMIANGISCSDLPDSNGKLHANKAAVLRYVEARGLSTSYANTLNRETSHAEEFRTIKAAMNWLMKKLQGQDISPGVAVAACESRYLPYGGKSLITNLTFNKPKRYYRNAIEGKTGRYNDQVKALAPYSGPTNTQGTRIVAIVPKAFEGSASDFLKRVSEKLKNTYHLKDVTITPILIDQPILEDYRKGIYAKSFEGIDLAIILISENHENLPPNISPYYYCKAKFIGQSIPTQEVQIETLRKSGLEYIIENVSLNIFAKLGGTPWVIETPKALEQEIIVGIGSTQDKQGTAVLGIANIFDYTGAYFVGECIPATGFEDYSSKLEVAVFNQMSQVIQDINEEIRVVFHIYKTPSINYEIKAMQNVITRLRCNSIKVAYVHVGYGHNFRLYNNDGNSDNQKGYYVHISDSEALVNFTDKGNTPLKIAVDRRSTFTDIYYLSQQAYWFSHLSFHGYLPAKRSVTIAYPQKMAQLTEKLKMVEGWDYEILQNVGNTLWFL